MRYGSGFHPFGTPTPAELDTLAAAMAEAGRSIDELEMVGGTRASFADTDDVADLDESMATFPEQWAQGYGVFCMKPSQHTDHLDEVEGLCRRMVERVAEFSR